MQGMQKGTRALQDLEDFLLKVILKGWQSKMKSSSMRIKEPIAYAVMANLSEASAQTAAHTPLIYYKVPAQQLNLNSVILV